MVRRAMLLCIGLGMSIGLTAGATQGKESPEVKQIKRALKHYHQVEALLAHADLDAAIAELREALRLDPDEAYWRSTLAEALEKKGQHELALEEYRQAVELSPDDDGLTQRYNELSGAGKSSGPSKAFAAGGAVSRPTVGGEVSAPIPTFKPEPRYAEKARKAKYRGVVALWIVVDQTVSVSHIGVVKPLGLGLDQNAIEAVRTWKFKPCTRDGSPVPCSVALDITFRLYLIPGSARHAAALHMKSSDEIVTLVGAERSSACTACGRRAQAGSSRRSTSRTSQVSPSILSSDASFR